MTNCTDTSAQSFDAAAALESTRANRAVARRRRWRPSQLARYRAELVGLRRAGGSYPDLAAWLRSEKRVVVSHTTVLRFLKQCGELADG